MLKHDSDKLRTIENELKDGQKATANQDFLEYQDSLKYYDKFFPDYISNAQYENMLKLKRDFKCHSVDLPQGKPISDQEQLEMEAQALKLGVD